MIRPDGDEVGVFLRQDSLDLPYEPNMESNKAVNQRVFVRVLLSYLLTNRNAYYYYHLDTFRCNNNLNQGTIVLHPPQAL